MQLYLGIDRPDQAEKQLTAMQAVDDDCTLTQLATAWVGTALGGAKVQEAFYIFQELGDKFVWTAKLHGGLSACQMRMGRWEDAESELLQVGVARWVGGQWGHDSPSLVGSQCGARPSPTRSAWMLVSDYEKAPKAPALTRQPSPCDRRVRGVAPCPTWTPPRVLAPHPVLPHATGV